jgi:hypothetical protein
MEKSMNPIVISFYTKKIPKRLIDSCHSLGIESDIEAVDSALKPRFILNKLQKWNRPVLWVDADAAFLQRPDFNDFSDCDFAVRVNEFLPKTHESRIVSNPIYARNTEEVMQVLEKWGNKMALREALHEHENLRFLPMPLKYAKIFDFDDLFISQPEIVIEHYQASRRFKNDHSCH